MNLTSKFKLRLIVFAAICISACGYGGRTINWKQEVKLSDGRQILLERESKQGPHDPLLNIRMELVQRIAFADPAGGEQIQWEIPKGLQPAMLDFDEEVPYMVLHVYTVADYNNWDCPNPPWLVYRYAQKEWSRIPLEQLPARFKKKNLLPAAEELEKLSKGSANVLISIREVEQYWKQYPLPEQAKAISREKISPIGKGCDEDVLVRLGRQSEIDRRR